MPLFQTTYIKLIQGGGWSIEEGQEGILGVLVLDPYVIHNMT